MYRLILNPKTSNWEIHLSCGPFMAFSTPIKTSDGVVDFENLTLAQEYVTAKGIDKVYGASAL